MRKSSEELAKEIIDENLYLTLATMGDAGVWASPLYYCTDRDYNFYFISQLSSLHTQNLLKNPDVSFAIYNSTAPEGKGVGVQGAGKVRLLKSLESIREGLKYYSTSFIECKPGDFSEGSPYRLFALEPTSMFVTDPDSELDARAEVSFRLEEIL